jgi:gas vesicle protein
MAGLDFSKLNIVRDEEEDTQSPTPAPVEPEVETEPTEESSPVLDFSTVNIVDDSVAPNGDEDLDPLTVSEAGIETAEETIPETPFQVLDKAFDEGLLGSAELELPAPTMALYDDIERGGIFPAEENYQRALNRYKMYREHPDADVGITGEVSYKGQIVPPPDIAPTFGGFGPTIGQKATYGIRNLVPTLAELGAAGIDYFTDGEYKLTEKAQKLDRAVPGDGITDTLIMEGASMMVPGTAALKLAKLLPKVAYATPVINTLAFELGAASGISSNAETLAIGENAMFKGMQEVAPILKGIKYDPDSPEYEKVLANRGNILMDAMMLGGALETTVKGVTWGARFAWSMTGAPILNIARPSAREDVIAREILDTLAGVSDDPATVQAARERIMKLVEENKDVWTEMPEGLADDIKYTTDTMSAIERAVNNGDVEGAASLLVKARQLRKGAIAKGASDTTVAASRPAKAAEEATKQMERRLGGEQAINEASEGFAEQGVREARIAEAEAGRAQYNLDNLDEAVEMMVSSNDAGVIGKLTQLEQKTGFNLRASASESSSALRDNLTKASEAMDTTRRELFDGVQGGAVDIEDMVSTLQALQPGQLDEALKTLPGDTQFATLLQQVKPQMVQKGEELVRETQEEVMERVSTWAMENGLDFARLFTEIRPNTVRAIGRLQQQGQGGAADVLIQFKKWIDDDAIDYVRQTGDEDVVDAAEEALRYHKEEWAPFWDDGSVLQQLGQARRDTIGRGKQGPAFADTGRNLIEDTINNRNEEVVGNMIELLKRPEGGESAPLVVDYIIGDALAKIASRVDDVAKLKDVDISDVRQTLLEYSNVISKNFPEEAKRLDALVERLKVARGDRRQLTAELEAATKAAEEARQAIYSKELSVFFDENRVPNINGYPSFEKLFTNKQAGNIAADGTMKGPLVELLKRAQQSGNPVLKDGLQAAYSRFLRENFLTATREAGGNRMVSMAAVNNSANQLNQVLPYGDIIFRDKPGVMRAVRTFIDEAGLSQQGRNAKGSGAGSDTAMTQQAMKAVDRTVTITVGVLSRLGARIRSAASGYIMSKVDPEASLKVFDELMSDPDYFLEIAQRVTKKDGAVDPEGANLLRKWLIRSGIYSEDNEPSEEEFLVQVMQAEADFRRAKGAVEQTTEALIESAVQ